MAKLVYIIDDSDACAETLEIALESIAGIELRSILGSRAAIVRMKESDQEIAAVITDLNLSNISGFDLIKELRADTRFAHTRIVLISGDSDPHLPERALAYGADAFFSKPYSPSAVRRKLEQLLW